MNNSGDSGVAVAILTVAISVPARATIISGTVTGGIAQTAGGTFVKLTVPLHNLFGTADSVGNDNFQSPNRFGFDEDQNILLLSDFNSGCRIEPHSGGNDRGEPLYFL